jgi:hypothetical protein
MAIKSIRSILILTFVAAVISAATRLAYDSYRYRLIVQPAWSAFPVSSTETLVSDENDIEISFVPESMELLSAAKLTSATDFQDLDFTGDLSGHYDLSCNLGEFRLIFTGSVWDNLPVEARGGRSAFQTMRDALALTPESPMTQLPLWGLRTKIGYSGNLFRIQHFKTQSKSGFVFRSDARTTMELFDSTGEYSVLIYPKITATDDWATLANHLKLSRQ